MKYSLIITSCNRFDLLEQTLISFFTFVDIKPTEIIIRDDSAMNIPFHLIILLKRQAPVNLIQDNEKRGQIYSIDACIKEVTTDYFFQLEDDWLFYRTGFIQESFNALKDANCINHWLRERNDTNGHPVKNGKLILNHKRTWHGFTFNPTLKRMSDYFDCGEYSNFGSNKFKAWENEQSIGKFYMKKGMYATIAEKGFVKHIGENRHITQG